MMLLFAGGLLRISGCPGSLGAAPELTPTSAVTEVQPFLAEFCFNTILCRRLAGLCCGTLTNLEEVIYPFRDGCA